MTDKKKKPSAINIKRLEELMTEQGLTIEELAERAGVSAATIASIRSNRRPNTTGDTIRKLARALFVTPSDLLKDGAVDEVPYAVRRLMLVMGELSQARQEELVRIADTLRVLEMEEGNRPLLPSQLAAIWRAIEDFGLGENADALVQALRLQFDDRPIREGLRVKADTAHEATGQHAADPTQGE